jgi:UDP-N-acetylmuramoylalanine--D-glutamate ligase
MEESKSNQKLHKVDEQHQWSGRSYSTRPFALEPNGLINGARLYNDSAAVRIDLVAESLLSFDEPVIWIMDSNMEMEGLFELRDIVKASVKTLIAVGEKSDDVHSTLWPSLGFFISAANWSESLNCAVSAAKANDSILFSPGTRARDPFANFQERGAYFSRLIRNYTPISP